MAFVPSLIAAVPASYRFSYPYLILQTDGAVPKPPRGPGGAGAVLYDPQGRELATIAHFVGPITTNNVAEYWGLIKGIELAAEFPTQELRIYTDSQLVVRQVLGQYQVRKAHLRPLREQVLKMLQNYRWSLQHIPRDQNTRADELSRQLL